MYKSLEDLRANKADGVEEVLKLVESSGATYIVVNPTQWAYLEQAQRPQERIPTEIKCLNVKGSIVIRVPNER